MHSVVEVDSRSTLSENDTQSFSCGRVPLRHNHFIFLFYNKNFIRKSINNNIKNMDYWGMKTCIINFILYIKGGNMLIELNDNNFSEEIKNGVKLVEFYTDWCGYCKKQKTELEAMDKIWIGQVNAEKASNIASKYQVNAFPTFILFKNGADVERFSGMHSKEKLMDKIMKYLK